MSTPPSLSLPVLLTGATGFVGRHLAPALIDAGYRVRGLTRHVESARRRWPGLEFVAGDLGDEAALGRALAGCGAAFYLVHGLTEGGRNLLRREVDAAHRFAAAAARAGIHRIVYLGGVAPASHPSEHLRSRLAVGKALRAGSVPTIELRASMIVGHGSSSWLIVRDLAARLPLMVLPRWLASRTQPVAIDDVIVALVRALDVPLPEASATKNEGEWFDIAGPGILSPESATRSAGEWFDIPGPEILSGEEILVATARVMGRAPLRMVRIPLLTPKLSSHWLRLVTRADWPVARELVMGLVDDLLAVDDRYWRLIGHGGYGGSRPLIPFAEAARRALALEEAEGPVRGGWGAVERMLATVGSMRQAR